jgi:hypothetical protein
VDTASTALNSASAGIKTIAASILSGKTAPASARDQVGTGLTTAQSALSNVTTLYPHLMMMLTEGTQAMHWAILMRPSQREPGSLRTAIETSRSKGWTQLDYSSIYYQLNIKSVSL